MGGFFGVVADKDCTEDLFYGTDYHSHLGTKRGGLAVLQSGEFSRFIHNIENAQFRSKFEDDIGKMHGPMGVGVISDYEDQPLIVGSHLGLYAIVTVGVVMNTEELVRRSLAKGSHFSEMAGGEINPTELVATLINEGRTFADGIRLAQESIQGSCSILLLTRDGLYAARDKYGRTPIVLARKDGAIAIALETCAFPNLGYEVVRNLGPGEIVRIAGRQVEQVAPPQGKLQICSFLWVYYGYPASSYEGVNVEECRYRCGAALAKRDNVTV
ncbi:MAG: amidophosphoribosyltransferase, partial [Phycisphaerae bacterium]|nr:amidophosphoribosyltransferase [Phycisphaerae bacterium]